MPGEFLAGNAVIAISGDDAGYKRALIAAEKETIAHGVRIHKAQLASQLNAEKARQKLRQMRLAGEIATEKQILKAEQDRIARSQKGRLATIQKTKSAKVAAAKAEQMATIAFEKAEQKATLALVAAEIKQEHRMRMEALKQEQRMQLLAARNMAKTKKGGLLGGAGGGGFLGGFGSGASMMGGPLGGAFGMGLAGGAGFIAAQAIVAGISAVSDAMKEAINDAKMYEVQMAKINTVANLTPAALQKVGQDIINLSKATGKTFEDLSNGMYDLYSAGIEGADALDVLTNSAKLAIAGLSTGEQATDLMTSAFIAFKNEGKSAAQIADIFAVAIDKGRVKAEDLAEAFGDIGPIASSSGLKLEEVASTLSFISLSGSTASEAATQMQSALRSLIKPNTTLLKLQDLTGRNYGELAKQTSLYTAMITLRNDAEDKGFNVNKLIGRIEGVRYLANVTRTLSDGTNEYEQFLSDTNDQLERGDTLNTQYGINMDTTAARQAQLNAKIEEFSIKLGQALMPILEAAISLFGGFVDVAFALGDALAKVSDGVDETLDVLQGGLDAKSMDDLVHGVNRAGLKFFEAEKAAAAWGDTTRSEVEQVLAALWRADKPQMFGLFEPTGEFAGYYDAANQAFADAVLKRGGTMDAMVQDNVASENYMNEFLRDTRGNLDKEATLHLVMAARLEKTKAVLQQARSLVPDRTTYHLAAADMANRRRELIEENKALLLQFPEMLNFAERYALGLEEYSTIGAKAIAQFATAMASATPHIARSTSVMTTNFGALLEALSTDDVGNRRPLQEVIDGLTQISAGGAGGYATMLEGFLEGGKSQGDIVAEFGGKFADLLMKVAKSGFEGAQPVAAIIGGQAISDLLTNVAEFNMQGSATAGAAMAKIINAMFAAGMSQIDIGESMKLMDPSSGFGDVKQFLEASGWTVQTAEDGAEMIVETMAGALAHAWKGRVAPLVPAEALIPKFDGAALAAQLTAQYGGMEPIISQYWYELGSRTPDDYVAGAVEASTRGKDLLEMLINLVKNTEKPAEILAVATGKKFNDWLNRGLRSNDETVVEGARLITYDMIAEVVRVASGPKGMKVAGRLAGKLMAEGATAEEAAAGLAGAGLSWAAINKIMGTLGYWYNAGAAGGGRWVRGNRSKRDEARTAGGSLSRSGAEGAGAVIRPWTGAGNKAGNAYVQGIVASVTKGIPLVGGIISTIANLQARTGGGTGGGLGSGPSRGPTSAVQNLSSPALTSYVAPGLLSAGTSTGAQAVTTEVNHNFRGLPPGISASEVAEQVRRGSDASGLARAMRYQRSFRAAP